MLALLSTVRARRFPLEQVRFSDRLRPSIEASSEIARAALPRFLLQPLVENALRHDIAQRSDAGQLKIRAWREGSSLVLTVRDDGPGLAQGLPPPLGVGLANTRARLAALYGESASLNIANTEGGGVVATVRLPYHEAESNPSRDSYSG